MSQALSTGRKDETAGANGGGPAPTWRDARVVIDARAAVRREIGGVERVTIEMATRLPRLRPDRYSVMRPQQMFAHRAGHFWEQALLPVGARRAEVLYCPANLAPAASRRTVVVIHDLAPLRHPGWYSPTFTSYQRRLLPLLANRARRVITPSEFSRRELAEGLDLDPQRVSVVPNGVDERFSPRPTRSPYAARSVSISPTCSSSAHASRARTSPRWPRRAASCASWGSTWWRRARAAPTCGPARRRPCTRSATCRSSHLPGLYAGALALAMPSLYEGFGLPVLEAMASGVPVVAADRAALPETCGGAALLVDPEDGTALADALAAAATDEELRERLVPAGLERATDFTWTRSAQLTDEVIGAVLDSQDRASARAASPAPGLDRDGRFHDRGESRTPGAAPLVPDLASAGTRTH